MAKFDCSKRTCSTLEGGAKGACAKACSMAQEKRGREREDEASIRIQFKSASNCEQRESGTIDRSIDLCRATPNCNRSLRSPSVDSRSQSFAWTALAE